jgi:hypothetical protein
MPQRTFRLEIVYNADGSDKQAKEAFEIVSFVVRKAAQELKAKLMMISGAAKPVVRFLTDDLHEGQIEHVIQMAKEDTAKSTVDEGPL